MVSAKGLLAADSNGLSDAYAKVHLEGAINPKPLKTKVVKQTLEPEWCDLILDLFVFLGINLSEPPGTVRGCFCVCVCVSVYVVLFYVNAYVCICASLFRETAFAHERSFMLYVGSNEQEQRVQVSGTRQSWAAEDPGRMMSGHAYVHI